MSELGKRLDLVLKIATTIALLAVALLIFILKN